jgi:3-methyladenine DNA glycosylase AlkD
MNDAAAADRAKAILDELRSLGSEENRAGMARFGINTDTAYGIPMTVLRPIARRYRRDHDLAVALWQTGQHEARILAAMIDDPQKVTRRQVDSWAADFDSWDLCDQACGRLFALTPFVNAKVVRWAKDKREFVRRAAFALIAGYTVHAKRVADAEFIAFLPLIEAAATDPRNFVRKAVNWALRQIGKRSPTLHAPALAVAKRLAASEDRTARWIGKDAVRELTDPDQRQRIKARGKTSGRKWPA